jgi:hypothetical protein
MIDQMSFLVGAIIGVFIGVIVHSYVVWYFIEREAKKLDETIRSGSLMHPTATPHHTPAPATPPPSE